MSVEFIICMNMDNTTHISKLLAYDALRPSQLFCSRVGMFPGLNQYLERFAQGQVAGSRTLPLGLVSDLPLSTVHSSSCG